MSLLGELFCPHCLPWWQCDECWPTLDQDEKRELLHELQHLRESQGATDDPWPAEMVDRLLDRQESHPCKADGGPTRPPDRT